MRRISSHVGMLEFTSVIPGKMERKISLWCYSSFVAFLLSHWFHLYFQCTCWPIDRCFQESSLSAVVQFQQFLFQRLWLSVSIDFVALCSSSSDLLCDLEDCIYLLSFLYSVLSIREKMFNILKLFPSSECNIQLCVHALGRRISGRWGPHITWNPCN